MPVLPPRLPPAVSCWLLPPSALLSRDPFSLPCVALSWKVVMVPSFSSMVKYFLNRSLPLGRLFERPFDAEGEVASSCSGFPSARMMSTGSTPLMAPSLSPRARVTGGALLSPTFPSSSVVDCRESSVSFPCSKSDSISVALPNWSSWEDEEEAVLGGREKGASPSSLAFFSFDDRSPRSAAPTSIDRRLSAFSRAKVLRFFFVALILTFLSASGELFIRVLVSCGFSSFCGLPCASL